MDTPAWPPGILDRMFRAPELVRERLLRANNSLAAASVPYAVIGANAVSYWVETLDPEAGRNTPNVDLLIPPAALSAAVAVLRENGFVPTDQTAPPLVMLDGPTGKPRQAVRLWSCGEVIGASLEPLPDVAESVDGTAFRVVDLVTLVRMKLSAFRTIDRVHLQDMLHVGLIDATWPDRYPAVLADRLREILADPDG